MTKDERRERGKDIEDERRERGRRKGTKWRRKEGTGRIYQKEK